MVTSNLALVVEDEKPLQIMYSRYVSLQGYETLVASDGREALKILEAETPALIFLDMLLPYVSGVEIIQYLSSSPRFQQTHVVIMSSNFEYRLYEHNFDSAEFHLKPLLPSHIKAITARLKQPIAVK